MSTDEDFGFVPKDQIEWDKVRKDYETTPKPLAEIANKYGIKVNDLEKQIDMRKWITPLAPVELADWELVRAAYEMTTEPLTALAVRFGIPRTQIVKRAAAEDWTDPRKSKDPTVQTGLTALQARFVEEYLRDLNATQAARRAGGGHSKWLNEPAVAEAISNAIAERSVRVGIDADRILQEWAAMGLISMGEIAEWDKAGNIRLRPSDELTVAQKAGIVEISQGKMGIKIKLDKIAALNAAAKHLGMFIDREDNKTNVNILITDMDTNL